MIAGRYDKFRFEQGATFDVKMTYRNKSTGIPFDFTGYTAAMSFKENAADGTAWKNNRIDATTVSGANIKIGDQVAFRLYRNPTDAQDTYPDDACVITFGIHYQIDTLGSRNITTK